MTSQIKSQDYRLVEEVIADGDIPVSIYENKITGLKVVNASIESPIVKGDLVFATEAFDDDGLPHTLEHLVFMGSEDYPYKGILDILAQRCLTSGTNAYTDTDHTNYTLSTAGSDGFLALLPIYLDHLLFPTLTDSAYKTEVHHIDGEGSDAGIVYCEMQAKENSGDSRCYLEMLRELYPGRCGYKSETGGLLKNLRESTSNEKVKNYHKEFYHSRNFCIVVTGSVNIESIFKAIKPIEDKIVLKKTHEIPFDRPWQTPVEPLPASVTKTIEYSSDTDEDGLVYIGFRGPNVVDNYKELISVGLLLDYLDSSAISPIQRDFVECSEPYCSSVSHSLIENSTSCFYITFESVDKQYLDLVSTKLFTLLKNIRQGTEKLDMDRLHTIISRKIVKILSAAETSPHSIVIGPVIGHFLYGLGEMKQRCQEIPALKELIGQSPVFWLDIIDKYMTGPNARYSCIVGKPSPQMMQTITDEEKKRVENQKEILRDKLEIIAEDIKRSVEANEIPAPKEIINSVKIPSLDSIKFHSIERVLLDESKVPFRLQYDSIKTNFVTTVVLLDTSKITDKADRLYLPLLSELILETPIDRDGTLIPYEKIVAELVSDTISYEASVGIGSRSVYSVGLFSMLFKIAIQAEISKYDTAVKWFHELLYKTVFTSDRIKTIATRMVSDISQYKRSGGKVTNAVLNGIAYQSNSNLWASNFMRQQKFLKQILQDLQENPELIIKKITQIRNFMTSPSNVLVHITLNKQKIDVSKIHEPWLRFFPEEVLSMNPSNARIDLQSIIPCHDLLQPVEGPKAAIVGVGSVESDYMIQLIKSINSPTDSDVAAVQVLIEYLTQLEGPMWRQVRGLGLSYHYSIRLSTFEGTMSFVLARSTHAAAAYSKAVEIVYKHLDGQEDFQDSFLESAKSSLVFHFIRLEKSAADKSMQSLLAYLRNLDVNYNRDLIQRVMEVTKDDLRRVGLKYLRPLFDSKDKLVTVCCNSSKLDAVAKGFGAANNPLEKISLDDEAFLTRID